MRRIAVVALAALAAGCSLLSGVDELSFGPMDGGDADTDTDTDTDIDTDTDTDTDVATGDCLNPYPIDTWPYSGFGTTAGQPDNFSNTCWSECCSGRGESVYLFQPSTEGNYTVEVWPHDPMFAVQIGVMELECADSMYCTMTGANWETSSARMDFYAWYDTSYFVVVEGTDADGPYDISVTDSAATEGSGTCSDPYIVGWTPFASGADTQSMGNNEFVNICNGECCPSNDAVWLFQPEFPGTFTITLTNVGYSDGYGFSLAVLENTCVDATSCIEDTSGAAAGGQMISVELEAVEYTPYYIVVQGMVAGGVFSLSIDSIGTTADGGVD